MTPFVKQGSVILWGRVAREPKLFKTKNGKAVANFSVGYGRKHDEDGNASNQLINVSVWGENAFAVADENTGLAKGDTVLLCGTISVDNYNSKEDTVYKLTAEIVIDMTTSFQLANMVVNANSPENEEEETVTEDDDDDMPDLSKPPEATEEETPFDDDETGLPF